LQTNDPYGQVTRNLKQSLKLSGVHFAPTPQTANVVLIIISEETSQQLLSVGGTQQTRQYNLTLTVTFELTNPAGKVIVSPQSISETQPATLQANQILAGSNEVNDLYQRMRLAIVYDIMNRLSSRDVSTALMTTL
jgi:outer membrane lipopolysaccharide assembly protein LptE/RlpB